MYFFLDSIKDIDYVDVLLVKNYEILEAQRRIRRFFLEGDYDALLLTSDDISVPYLAPLRIMQDMEIFDYDIVTGWSTLYPRAKEANINEKPPEDLEERLDKPFYREWYKFLTVDQIRNKVHFGIYHIPVWFVGWSITGMKREVVEKWTPRGWYFQEGGSFTPVEHDGKAGFWASSDLWYSYQMWKLGYQPYADLTVFVPHFPPPRSLHLLVGVEPSGIEFRPARRDLDPVDPEILSGIRFKL